MQEKENSVNSNASAVFSPRLTRLELHGYKTFADKTQFLFTGGITAIVGPNGSGKSNVADAIRWVLGEQSYTVLRGKRTEDMIFSGSEQRPRMGMASVSVTFDNQSGWLPIDYTTVVITRRAFRSGENEYFINGTRVRLRDVQELLAASGLAKRSCTVIGQGLIDQALSLRPEERRVLIEEAAGISAYKRKRDQALSRLAEVQSNLVRVRDILAEITPRLKRLEKQAARAREHDLLEAELRTLLLTWYGYRWHQSVEALAQARMALDQQKELFRTHQERIRVLERELQHLHEERSRLKAFIGEQHGRIATLHKEIETLLREEAVIQERRRGLEAQRENLLSEFPALEAQLHVLEERLHEALARQQQLAHEEAQVLARLEEARQRLSRVEIHRRQAEEHLRQARERVLTLTSQQARLEAEIERLREEDHRLESELERRVEEEQQGRRRLASARDRLQKQQEIVSRLQAEQTTLERHLKEVIEREKQARAHMDRVREKLRQALETVRRLEERYEWLTRLREEGTGLFAGVRSVLQAGLPGVIGVVAELIHVPPVYERAIEEALGASVQDVVVERWSDAEHAITYLKKQRGGRATFLPLDTLRPPRRIGIPKAPGVIGLAADLVRSDPRLRPVVELLLNRTLVVENLRVARRVLGQAGGMRIVTLDGELVRPSGRVTGGEGSKTRPHVLAREREWREMPEAIEKARDNVRELEAHLHDAERALQAILGEAARLREHQKVLQRRYEEAREKERRLERELDRAESAYQAAQMLTRRVRDELESVKERFQQVREEYIRVVEALSAARVEETAARRALNEVVDEDVEQEVRDLEAQHASLMGRKQALEQNLNTLREDISRQQELLETRHQRLTQLEAEILRLTQEEEQIAQRLGVLRERVRSLESPMQEAQERLAHLDAQGEELQRALETARRRLHDMETQLSHLTLSVQRAEDKLTRLREDIEADFGLVRPEESAVYPAQEPLPFDNRVVTLPRVTHIPPSLEEDIKRLRIRLRNLGAINPNAPTEYEELKTRYDFLQSQIEDLERASADLQKALKELEALMQKEFKRTFHAVARKFREYFERLFGGGTARLVLTQPDNLQETGIDIIARPPRKRTQSLAMLSGGERALTAASLIFAILDVSPPPFCVLDEVDAALDEANVGRFRDTLKELSRRIQFIVITHNRYTIEAADAIYGISMGKDGVSRTLSLRLEEYRTAA